MPETGRKPLMGDAAAADCSVGLLVNVLENVLTNSRLGLFLDPGEEDIVGLWNKLFGGEPAAKAPAAAKPTKQDLMAQRQALATKLMTPDRQERLAQAFQAQAAKQQLKQNLQSDAGQRALAAKLQKLMKDG